MWLLLLGVSLGISCGREDGPERPNFVWIVSEDNSTHYMELFDPHGIATPNIGRMAENGILFTRAFSNAPVCSVARSSLMSSCYGPRTGAQFHRRSQLVPMPEGTDMFPAALRKAGYYTTNSSKEDYNYLKGEGMWDESSRSAHWKNREPGQSFFHMESHPESHESRLHFNAEFIASYKPTMDPDDVHVFPNHPDTDLFRFTGAYYRDCMLVVDSIVGKVLRELEEAGELESTFVFYFGDHGGVLPGSKGYLYETGLHVPLVVRIPARFRHLVHLKKGEESGDFVSFVDFGPTVLELAGVAQYAGVDGRPFLGEGRMFRSEEQQISFGYADRFDEKYDLVRSVRKGRLKYLRSYQPFNVDGLQNNYRYRCLAFQQWREMFRAGQLNEIQSRFFLPREPEALYDLENDPYETNNLAGDPGYVVELKEMRGLLAQWVKDLPDLSFVPENELRRHAFSGPVAFGQEHREQIARLVDLADLQLRPFGEAREEIGQALYSEDPLDLYWGLIDCSAFGKEAVEFAPRARELCSHEDLLVQTRAAEFLGLTGLDDPVPVITEALYRCDDGVEALLILNSLVLLKDGPYAYRFSLDDQRLAPGVKSDAEVQRRLDYIQGRIEP